MPDPDGQIHQSNWETLRSCGPRGIRCTLTKELFISYGSVRMVKLSASKLWCQNSGFLKYYTAFVIQSLVDILELLRQLPNFENDFTGSSTRTMMKNEFTHMWPTQRPKGHKHNCVGNRTSTVCGSHLKENTYILLNHFLSCKKVVNIFSWWSITSANSIRSV